MSYSISTVSGGGMVLRSVIDGSMFVRKYFGQSESETVKKFKAAVKLYRGMS